MKTIIDELLNELIVENNMPESLIMLFLGFFNDEDHEEIIKFIKEKLEKSKIAIPSKMYLLLELLYDDLAENIYELDEYFSGSTDNNPNIYLN